MQVLSLNVRSAAANNTLRSTYNTPQYPKMDTFRVAPAANSIHVLLSSKDPSALNVAHGNLIKDNIIQVSYHDIYQLKHLNELTLILVVN